MCMDIYYNCVYVCEYTIIVCIRITSGYTIIVYISVYVPVLCSKQLEAMMMVHGGNGVEGSHTCMGNGMLQGEGREYDRVWLFALLII